MAGRLSRVQVEVAGKPAAIQWESREALMAELGSARVAGGIVEAFSAVGASLPVELTREQKILLVALLDGWGWSRPLAVTALNCVECGLVETAGARGWRAYVCNIDDDGHD